MTFYQELQLNAAGSKNLIKNSKDGREKFRHIITYIFKVVLTLAFCVAFVVVFQTLFGAENSYVGVAVLLFVLVFRLADLGIKVKDSMISLAIIYLVLMFGPHLANMVHPVLGMFINGICIFVMVFLGCHNILMCNHATFLISYFLLWGNDVSGRAYTMRLIGLLVGGILTIAVFYFKHKTRTYKRDLKDVFKEFHPYSVRGSWQIRITVGVALAVCISQLLGFPRPMWIAFVTMSVLQPMPADTPKRVGLRFLGTLGGGILFAFMFTFVPESIQPMLGFFGGLCVGFCANYGWQTVFNSFSAMYSAIAIFGLIPTIIIRYFMNFVGGIYIFLFDKIMYKILTNFNHNGEMSVDRNNSMDI